MFSVTLMATGTAVINGMGSIGGRDRKKNFCEYGKFVDVSQIDLKISISTTTSLSARVCGVLILRFATSSVSGTVATVAGEDDAHGARECSSGAGFRRPKLPATSALADPRLQCRWLSGGGGITL